MIYLRSTYTGSPKKKVAIRVLIVIAALLAVSAATIAFGNHLKTKAEETTVYGLGAGRGDSSENGVGRDRSDFEPNAKGVRSACIALSAITSEQKAKDQVDLLATKGFTGVTVVLVDRDGYLSYTSQAVAKFTKQKAADVKDPAIVSAITAQAKAHSMRSSAVIFASDDFTSNDFSAKIDSIVASDAAELGFDEVVAILPLDAASLDSILAASAVKYVTALDETKGAASLGAALPLDVFTKPSLSPQVELFASVCDFLAIDLSKKSASAEDAEKAVSDMLDSISGYFTMYDLRAVFDGSDQKISDAQVNALYDGGFSNYMFVWATDFVETDKTDDTKNDGDTGKTNDGGDTHDQGGADNGGSTDPEPQGRDTEPSHDTSHSEPANTEPSGGDPGTNDPTDDPGGDNHGQDGDPNEPDIPDIPDIPDDPEIPGIPDGDDPGGADGGN